MGRPAEDLLRDLYAAFNARDLDALLAAMAEDVDWPNGWEGGREVGRDAVRAYWTRQWAAIDPSVEPAGFEALPDGRLSVQVHQTIRSLDGALLADQTVHHIYTFTADALISRMDIAD